jgi:hypothetical protein
MNTPIHAATGLRITASVQVLAMLAQAVLAGLALSGRPVLQAHMVNGAIVLLAGSAQMIFALWLRRSNRLPRYILAATIALPAGEALQMASGRLGLLAVHLPLGVGLFGLMAGLTCWLYSPRQLAGRARAGVERARWPLGTVAEE